MNFSALLTSAGINIGICVVLFSLYSVLRKQPSNVRVYFGRRLESRRSRHSDPFALERYVPSPRWIVEAWESTEKEILTVAGLDAVVLVRMIIFSMRVFSIAATVCSFLVLPVNYYGREMIHKMIPSEKLEVFTIENVKENSKWLWAHCLALYIISCSACLLLYFEYKDISNMRLLYIAGSPLSPGQFTVLVRSIPWSPQKTYSDSVKEFFSNYHGSSYLSHHMVHHSGTVQKLMRDAEKMYKKLKATSAQLHINPDLIQCGFCGTPRSSFKLLPKEPNRGRRGSSFGGDMDLASEQKDCAAAFVFFKTRYAAVVATQVVQSSNPMSWVTDMAPEPPDVFWSSLSIPYQQLWVRKRGILLAAFAFMLLFIFPVTFAQSLTQLDVLQHAFPFIRGLLRMKFVSQLAIGYLPSVILIVFFYAVPPFMMFLSAVEGNISRSWRKRSACWKVLIFNIWNIYFMNIFTGSLIRQLSLFLSVKDIPAQLGKAVPAQASFFMTYVLSSGWASLSVELMQPAALLNNLFTRWVLRKKDVPSIGKQSFPYHTEVPRVLLFGLIGFTCSVLAPLILPFLLVYYFLAYLVYKNQVLNVYLTKYETGGQYWPIAHNSTIFSLVMTQIIALGVFGLKRSPIAIGFTVPLVIGTLLFHTYCTRRFLPIFSGTAAEVLIEMDRKDEQGGRVEHIYEQWHSAYCQFTKKSHELCNMASRRSPENGVNYITDSESLKKEEEANQLSGIRNAECSERG